ncbi:MAG: site-2 protease family protein [Calditrichaeota bacterium]|nr:MAG: site-2 protease family protein [Calditrichota bacterium]
MELFTMGLLWYAVFLFSTTLHEAAHALAALKMGDPTAYFAGQVTLDPLPHIRREPVGTVLVPLLSYIFLGWMMGWASAPYNPTWARQHPRQSAYMALAGPAANLVLVFLAVLGIQIGIHLGIFIAPMETKFGMAGIVAARQDGLPLIAATLLSILFSLNMVLFIFNLIPLPPLDGSGVFPLFLSKEKAVRLMDIFQQRPELSMIGLLVAIFLFEDIFRPVYLFTINSMYPGMTYHWTN